MFEEVIENVVISSVSELKKYRMDMDLEFSTIGDSFDSRSSSSDEENFSLSNTREASDFLLAVNSSKGKSVAVALDASSTLNNLPSVSSGEDIFDFSDENEVIERFRPISTQKSELSLTINSCCDSYCNSQILSAQVGDKIEKLVRNKKKGEIKDSLLNQLYAQKNLGLSTHGFMIGGHFFCWKSFCSVSKVSYYLVREIFRAFSIGQKHFIHGNVVGLRETAATIGFICWVKTFAENFGNYAPDEKVIVISAVFTVKEIYELYKVQAPDPQVAKSSFYNLLKTKFGPKRVDRSLPCVRISSYSTHSRCDQCLLLERFQRSCQTEDDLNMAKELKQEHKQTYVRARVAIEEKRLQAISDPNSHVFIQGDLLKHAYFLSVFLSLV